MIYINGVTKADFDAYVAQLESAGITGDVTDIDGIAYIYGGQKDSLYANLDFYVDTTKTTADKVNGIMVDVEYNFLIALVVVD